METLAILGLPLFGATIAITLAAVVTAAHAWRTGRRRWLPAIGLALSGWVALYAAMLVTTSLASVERALAPGERLAFCGLYIDCHLGVEVVSARRAEALGPPGAEADPRLGEFVVVTLRVSSDAVRATLQLEEPIVVLHDAGGNVWERSREGEEALARSAGGRRPLAAELPAGGSYLSEVAFDVTPGAGGLRLDVAPGSWAERLSELFLIGDDDSLLHPPPTLRLPGAEDRAAATYRVS